MASERTIITYEAKMLLPFRAHTVTQYRPGRNQRGRATAGYCFSPLFGLLRTSRGFTALHTCDLKARDSKGDGGNFPCNTGRPRSRGLSPPFSATFYSLWFHSLPKRKTKPWSTRSYSLSSSRLRVAHSNLPQFGLADSGLTNSA
jgi:hypothetical protein